MKDTCKDTYSLVDRLVHEANQQLQEANSTWNSYRYILTEEPTKRRAVLDSLKLCGDAICSLLRSVGLDATYDEARCTFNTIVTSYGVILTPFINTAYVYVPLTTVHELRIYFNTVEPSDHHYYLTPMHIGSKSYDVDNLYLPHCYQYSASTAKQLVVATQAVYSLLMDMLPPYEQCISCHYADAEGEYCGVGVTIYTLNCSKWRAQ